MRLTHNDIEYTLDLDRLTAGEARFLKRNANGMTIGEFANGLIRSDVDAVIGALYFAKVRAGEALKWSALDDVNVIEIINSIKWSDTDDEDEDESSDEDADDPKETPSSETTLSDSDSGTTPTDESPTTSGPSPDSSDSTPGTSTA